MRNELRILSMVLLLAAACLAQVPAQARPAKKPAADRALQEFNNHVNLYLALQKDTPEKNSAGKQHASAEKIEDSRRQLAERIRAERAGAKRGDIFSDAVAAMFRHRIAQAMKGKDGAKIRASLRNAEPVKDLPLKANDVYPQKAPKQSMPPSLLMALPPLPKELDYRIVGRDLVLHDVDTDLVVDFIPGVLPDL